MKKLTIFASVIVLVLSLSGCGKTASSKTTEIATIVKEPVESPAQTETSSPVADTAAVSNEATAEDSEPAAEVQTEKPVSVNPMSVNPDDYFVDGVFDMDAYAVALGYETCYTDSDESWSRDTGFYALKRDNQEFYPYLNSVSGINMGYYTNGKTILCGSRNIATDDIVLVGVRDNSVRINLAYPTFITTIDLLAYAAACDVFIPSEAPFYLWYAVDVYNCEPYFTETGKFYAGELRNLDREASFHSDTGNYPLD